MNEPVAGEPDFLGPDPVGPDPVAPDLLATVRRAALVADDSKGLDTLIIDVGDVLSVSDYFVITSAANRRLVRAIAGEIEDQVRAAGGLGPSAVEGLAESEWVLLDYGPFVVHVFHQPQREFYRLERIWRDCPLVAWRLAAGADQESADCG